MAKHQQQLHDKLLASLTKMLAAHEEQHKEAKGVMFPEGLDIFGKGMPIGASNSHRLSHSEDAHGHSESISTPMAPINSSNPSQEHSKGTFGLHPPMNIQVSPPSCLETGEGEVLMPPDKDKEDASSAGTASVHPTLFGVPSPRPAGEIQVTPTNIQRLGDGRILTWVLGTLSFLAAMTSGSFHAFLNLGIRLLRVALTSEELHLAINRLHLFVADFHLDWSEVSGQESRKYCHAWLLLVFSQVIVQGLQYYILHTSLGVVDGAYLAFMVTGVVQVLVFAACSAIVMVAAYALSHLILGLDKTLDCWCCHIVNTPHFEFGVQSWNNMQALLKCVGRELASAFIMMQALSALGFMFLLANGVAYAFRIDVDLLPTLVEGLAALPLIFLFGALGKKEGNSSAGFFVRDVKLTQEMFVKQFILVGGILSGTFGALSRIYAM
eukprot:g9019.t1